MGNKCCRKGQASPEGDFIEDERGRTVMDINETPEASSIVLGKFKSQNSLSTQALKLLSSPLVTQEANLILDEKTKFSSKNLTAFFDVSEDQLNGFKLYQISTTSGYLCSSELCALFDLNINQEEIKFCDESIESYEVLDLWKDSSSIVYITRFETGKTIVMGPREAIVANVLSKDPAGRVFFYSIGIDQTELKDLPKYKAMLSKSNNYTLVELSGRMGIDSPEGCEWTSIQKMNPKTNVGKSMLKPFLKKSLKTRYTKYNEMMIMYAMSANPKYQNWFKDDPKGPLRIITQNLSRFSVSGLPEFGFSSEAILKRLNDLRPLEDEDFSKPFVLTGMSGVMDSRIKMSVASSEEFVSVISRDPNEER